MSTTPLPADERLASLSPAKRAALERLLLARKAKQAAGEPIPVRDAEAGEQLSFAEQRLWLLDRLEPNHPFYNMPLAARLVGDLDADALADALAGVTARHETLRYAYDIVGGEPVRRVLDSVAVTPTHVDLRGVADADAELQRRIRGESRRPFDLSSPPLLRCVVYRLADDEHVVLLVMHHIVSDGWSMWVMMGELAALYDAATARRGDVQANGNVHAASPPYTSPLPPLPIQYSDYGVWQRERLAGERLEQQTAYWQQRLGGAPPAIELPTDHPRRVEQDFDGAVLPIALGKELSRQLKLAAERLEATPFMVLMAAYQAWLSRYSGRADLCVGTVVAGRQRAELERLIGFFVNTLALRVDLADDPAFDTLAARVREDTLTALAHQDLPFEQVLEAAAPDRERSHDALFSTALVVQNPPRDFARGGGLEVTPLPVDNGTAKYDLTFFFWEDPDGDGATQWVGQAEYRTSLFERSTIERFVGSFRTLLAGCLSDGATPVSRLPVLDADQQQAFRKWNATDTEFSGSRLIHEVVAGWFIEKADAAAIRHNGGTTSYAELDIASREIAAGLQARGVGVGRPVVVCLPRGADSLSAMLGVWRAGGVYVPVDPASMQRLDDVVADAGATVVVTEYGGGSATTVAALRSAHRHFVPAAVSPRDLAYIIYTSGSTGRPKGVEIEHASLVNFFRAQKLRMGVTPDDRVLHAMSPAFDGGLAEAVLGLAGGSTLVVADRETTLDPAAFTRLLAGERVTVGKFTPALLATLDPAQLPEMTTMASAGDLLTGDLATRWQPGRRFFNGYGPTEVTVGVSMFELPGPPTGPPPVGPPFANTRAYVLDPSGEPTPIGVVGEITIGGAGVARGYRNLPEETAAKFVPDPFTPSPPGDDRPPRMYRTGDLGRWRADGVLEFAGRLDDQVQIRGYRVEPGEVTSALEALPAVEQACTVTDETAAGQRLVAYVVPSESGAGSGATQGDPIVGQHLASWQTLMDQTHRATGALRDPEFDITGWVSTFTGLPIPRPEMQRWAASTCRRVLDLQPRDVLEIGCGGGLILLGVAPDCRSYVGTDFLARSLKQLRGVLDRKPDAWARGVELLEQPAHELGPLAGRKFDTIVLNSVVQYFPSLDYLLGVLEMANGLLAEGGKIFLGDLRDLRLHEAMAAAVEIGRAEQDLSRRQLLGRVESRLRHEEELLLSPELFGLLHRRLPRLSCASLLLKEGRDANELTRYRYDAVLRFNEECSTQGAGTHAEPKAIAWDQASTPRATVRAFLESGADAVVVQGLVNRRVAGDTAAWRRLRDDPEATSAVLHAAMDASPGVEPQDWLAAAQELGGCIAEPRCVVTGNTAAGKSDTAPEAYDVVLRRPSTIVPIPHCTVSDDSAWLSLANRPLDEKRAADLTPRIREELAERLPAYMIPTAYVVLDRLPQTVAGKVDREALPPPPAGRPAWASGFVEPAGELEQQVAAAWEELLGVSPVGAEDNFFDLGGHSMLAVRAMAEVERRTGVAAPLAALFQEPTVRHVASLLADPEAADEASSLITLQPTGDAPPLYCVHPAGGTVFCYQALASHFAGERPVIGVQAQGVDGRRPPHESMGEMAAHYARLIRRRKPEGPYHLCGWSLGGNIAYAVAARLREEGAEVGLVGLFDAGATPPEESLSEDDLAPLLQALFPEMDHLPIEELRLLEPDKQVSYFTQRAVEAGLVDGAQLAASQHVFQVFQKNVQAVHQHRSTPYSGPVTVFRAAQQAGVGHLAEDPKLGWGVLAAEVAVVEIASDHARMMQRPQVDTLADRLSSALELAEASPADD